MEASGCALRQLPRAPGSLLRVGRGGMGLPRAVPSSLFVGHGGFSDEGHLRYYARCGGKVEREEKKRTKLVKGLSRDLAALLEGTAVSCAEGMVQEAASGSNKAINEAASILLARLEEARASEKAMKKLEKEMRKAQKKASMMDKTKGCGEDSSSSSSESSSSESSDSECDGQKQVVDMSRIRTAGAPLTVEVLPAVSPPSLTGQNASAALPIPELKSVAGTECCSNRLIPNAVVSVASGSIEADVPARCSAAEEALSVTSGASSIAGRNKTTTACSMTATVPQVLGGAAAVAAVAPTDSIEVCVGGKCKKSGSLQLMEELQRQVGAEGAVVGCKCMGKCKEGPNVRMSRLKEDGAPPVKGPLCVGVSLDDVSALVSSYFGDQDLGFMAAAS